MLRERHEKQTSLPAPHPTIATMGMTRKERTAVTKPYNRTRIMKMNKRVPLLQQIIEAAKHCELMRRIENELDNLAKSHYQAFGREYRQKIRNNSNGTYPYKLFKTYKCLN